MNKAMRLLALAGAGAAAGAMLATSPVQAAPSAGQSSGSAGVQTFKADYEYVVGHYKREWQCERAGFHGKRVGAWDDYDCDPVRAWRGWVWELEVEEDAWEWDSWKGGWPGGWPYKPDYIGGPFHVGGKPWKHKGGKPPWMNDKNGPWGDHDKHDGPKGPWGGDKKDGPWDNDDDDDDDGPWDGKFGPNKINGGPR
jgi:hypothetical protein